jgi:hypothetical protein
MRISLAAKRLPGLHSDIFQNQCAMPTSKMQPATRNRNSKEIIRANIGNVIVVERPLGRRALGGFLEKFETNQRALLRLCGYAP